MKGLDIEYPDAFIKVQNIFSTLGSEILMARCSKKFSQNINESVHSKLWRRVLKFKAHSAERYKFCCLQVYMEHNFGHYAGTLLHCLASMTRQAEIDLKQKDKESIRVAKRKHTLLPGGNRTKHRKKVNVTRTYEAGMEPIQ